MCVCMLVRERESEGVKEGTTPASDFGTTLENISIMHERVARIWHLMARRETAVFLFL